MKSKNYLLLLSALAMFVSCGKEISTETHGPLIDLGITDEELEDRLNMSVVGESPDGDGNPDAICNDGLMQNMDDDPYCGYVDIGYYCISEINRFRAMEGLPPFVRAYEYESCTSREARLALEAGASHYNDGCGWRSQASSGGGRGGDDSNGTVKKSVAWLPYLIYQEGPDGGHYQGMMTDRSRGAACGYYAYDRNSHRIFINYYDNLD